MQGQGPSLQGQGLDLQGQGLKLVSSHDAPGPLGPGSKTRSSQKPDISSPATC